MSEHTPPERQVYRVDLCSAGHGSAEMSEHTPLTEAEREPESLRRFREAHEAAIAQGYTEGDVNHYVQPIVGMLRLAAHQGESIQPDQAERFAEALMKGCNAEAALLAYLKDAARTSTATADAEGCWQPCDPDCEVGPIHCEAVHLPSHKAKTVLHTADCLAAAADTGLRERVEALADQWERLSRDYSLANCRPHRLSAHRAAGQLRAMLDATPASTEDRADNEGTR